MNTEGDGPRWNRSEGREFVAHVDGWDLWQNSRGMVWAKNRRGHEWSVSLRVRYPGVNEDEWEAIMPGAGAVMRFVRAWHAITQ